MGLGRGSGLRNWVGVKAKGIWDWGRGQGLEAGSGWWGKGWGEGYGVGADSTWDWRGGQD